MRPLIASTFLDSQKILEHYYIKGFDGVENWLCEFIFVELHAKDPYKPDYIYKNAIADFVGEKFIIEIISNSLTELANVLHFRGEKIYVRNELFERWQEIILSVSPLMIISYKIHKYLSSSFRIDKTRLISTIFEKSALPSIYEPQLEYMIANGGLNEIHMHLNGTTESDFVWQDALNHPSKFYSHIKKSLYDKKVSEQYFQIGNLKQQDMYSLLMIARRLRDVMIKHIFDDCNLCGNFTKDFYDIDDYSIYYSSILHPMDNICGDLFENPNPLHYESLFFIKAFEYLESSKNRRFANLLHYYMLIHSFFQKIMVQQKTQVGFDQFQKITLNETRELTEDSFGRYKERYNQLQGMYGNSLASLEGRFAPKDTHDKLSRLLKKIISGYSKENEFELLLVPHFIKQKDKRNSKEIITFRDLELRIKNKKTLDVLLKAMQNEKYQKLIVGFDAAANELHAWPEVFAPIFRKLRFLGYSNFTYHAGEDFIHLISGLRMVYETVEFLDMSVGNRIGHATALGIDPALWKQRLYDSKLTIKKGEWLDNLIFAYELLKNYTKFYGHIGKLQDDIFRYFNEIYNFKRPVSIYQIVNSWKSRKFDPMIVLGWREPSIFDEFEKGEIKDFLSLDKTVQELYELYHTGECIEKYNCMIQIMPDEKPFDVETLYCMQNMMIDHLNSKGIVIETLLTSNVRISYYKNYSEHHLWRWLGFAQNQKENEPKPTIVVGSDDTGIFMTNLRNEYAHIYETCCKIKDNKTATAVINELNQNSKTYTFRKV